MPFLPLQFHPRQNPRPRLRTNGRGFWFQLKKP